MINTMNEVKTKINRLIAIELTKGVQPEDLANNIFLDDYEKIYFYKKDEVIIGELVFVENIYGECKETTLRYTYNQDKQLNKIEEVNKEFTSIQWDRNMVEHELINEIIGLMKDNFTREEVKNFIKTLPRSLKDEIHEKLLAA